MGATVLAMGLAMAVLMPSPASATITAANASQLATAMAADAAAVTGASFSSVPPSGTPNGVGDSALGSFPTDGSTFAILTSGNAFLADDADTSESSGVNATGDNVRGDSDYDVTILKVDLSVPQGINCLSVDFRFLSEEFVEFVNTQYNDAFIAELDTSSWSIGTPDDDTEIVAPANFAFDPSGNVISINSSGVANMSAEEAAGTTYDGATPLLRAYTPITSGNHSVYFSIFDQGDPYWDSAVFLDNLSLGTSNTEGGCEPGAQLPPPTVSKTADLDTSEPGGANGYTITVTNPNAEDVDLDSISDTLPDGFSYGGSTTGATTEDPSEDGQLLVWSGPFTVPAESSIELSFDVSVPAEPGEYLNEATAAASGFTIESTGPTAPVTVGLCEPVTLEGTGAGDKLVGGATADLIQGLNGRDILDGLAAGDDLCGGNGSDYLYGRDGADLLLGEAGNDRLYGAAGVDEMEGGPGHDAYFPGRGADTILAQDGTRDCIRGDLAADTVETDGNDLVNPSGGCPPGFWL